MANFSELLITDVGKSALAKLASGTGGKLTFTKAQTSDKAYSKADIPTLDTLLSVQQTHENPAVSDNQKGVVTISAMFENSSLQTGYFIRTVGLYARSDGEEFLFAVALENSENGCYMSPYNGRTNGSVIVNMAISVGEEENITIETNSTAVATTADIQNLQKQIEKINQRGYLFTIPVEVWEKLEKKRMGCSFSASVEIEDVSSADFPEIFFDEKSIENATNACVIVSAENGKLTFYAKSSPKSEISGVIFIRKGEQNVRAN